MNKINKYYSLFILLAIVYVLLIIMIPPHGLVLIRYNLTPDQAKLVSLSIAPFIIGIWYTAFYGFVRFKQYAESISKSRDGKQLTKVADGLFYLALSMPAGSITTSSLNYLATRRPELRLITTIVTNYVILILVLGAFYLIYNGARGLILTLKKQTYSYHEKFIFFVFLVVGVLYAFVTLTNPTRQFPATPTTRAAYYMPDLPLVLTIIIPYLFVWYFGISAAYYIRLYRQKAKGVLYKQALSYLAFGLGTVIISSMLVRFLVSFNTLLSNLTLRLLLIVIYVLLVIIFVGYLLIARGASKLRKIEEV